MLRKWWLRYGDLEPVIGLYLSALPGRVNHKFVEFLLLTQALEAYHRRMIGGEYESRPSFRGGIYRELVQAIPENVDQVYRRRIVSGLKYLNEYSLRKRLRNLIRLRRNSVVFAFQDREEAIEQIIDLRNKFTHYDEAVSEADFMDINLWRSTARAKVLLDSCLLHELGLTEEAAKNAIDINCGRNGAHVLL
jgi:Apea-like HEPN